MSVAKQDVTIPNASGLHLRPAATFVQVANRHKGCEIHVTREGQRVNGKSIMGLVMLAAPQDSVLTIEVSGENTEEALAELVKLVETGFGME